MEQDHDGRVTAAAVGRLAANVGALAEEVGRLPGRLEKLEKREWRSVRLIRALVAGVAVVALLAATATAGLAWWNLRQDASHRAQQQQNTAFRRGLCKASRDWQTYLAQAPAGSPAGQEAAARLEALFRSLCERP